MAPSSQPNGPLGQQADNLLAIQKLLRATLDSSTDMIQVFEAVRNQQGQIIDFTWLLNNHAAENIYGDVIGKSLLQLQPGVVEEGIFDAFKQVVETGLPQQYEKQYVHEQFDGWFYQSVVKLNDGVATTTADITDRKKAEEEIIRLNEEAAQRATDKYFSIFNSIDEGFYLCEVIFDEVNNPVDILYLEENPAAVQMIGQSFVGKRLRDISPLYEEYWYQLWGDAALSGASQRLERYSEADQKWFSFIVSKFGGKDSRQVTVTFQDITERKRREATSRLINEVTEQLLQGEQLDDSITSVCKKIGVYFGAAVCAFSEIDEDQGTVQAPYIWHVPGAMVPTGVYSISEYHSDEVQKLMRSNKPEIVPNTHDFPEAIAARYRALGIGSYVNLPFVRGGKWQSTLSITKAQPYPWHQDEIDLMRDLTVRIRTKLDRVRAEAALRKSEEKYRTLFESIDEGFLVHEMVRDEAGQATDFRLLEINPAFTRQTGLGNDTVGKLASEFLPNLERFWIDTYDRVARTGISEWVENYNQATHRWYSVHVSRVGGQDHRVAVVFEDITERKHREQEQAFLLMLGDTLRPLSDPVAIEGEVTQLLRAHFDAGWCYYVEWDETTKLGLVRRDATGTGLASLVGEHDVSDVPEFVELLKANPLLAVSNYETYAMLTPALRQRYTSLGFRSMLVATLVKQERLAGSLLIGDTKIRPWSTPEQALLMQVAERTWAAVEQAKAEEELTKSEAKFRTLFNSIDEGFSLIELIFDEAGHVVDYWHREHNPAFSRMTGLTDVIGKRMSELVPELEPEWHQMLETIYYTGEPLRLEYPVKQLNQWYRGYLSRMGGEGSSFIACVYDEITERKRAEEALQQADRRKDEFLAMLAHELRNPMSTIRSGLDILDLTITEEMPRSTVEMMSRQTDHLVRMVDDLLDVSRISRGKIELKKGRVNLVEIVSQAIESVRTLYQEQERSLWVDLPSAPIYLEGDATRLTQVVANLLTNGARYTGEQGQVWLRLKHQKQEAILQVRDNGIGLPTDQLSAIFELFVQVDNSLARSKGGLGLGLTLVKRLVEMHGGGVEAQSEGLGKGSTFIVHLPTLTTAAEQPLKPTPQLSNPAAAKRILVIDDNVDAALTLAMLLKLKGYEAHTRNSGRTGIEAAESLQPAAILLDIGMPDLDGYATCRLIREQPWGQHILVIALTGYGQAEDRQRTREAGFDEHLVKPVDLDVLTKLLTDLLAKRSSF